MLIGYRTVIQELVNGLESGAAIVNVLGSALAGTTAGSLEGPGQACQLARDLGNFNRVTLW